MNSSYISIMLDCVLYVHVSGYIGYVYIWNRALLTFHQLTKMFHN